MMPPVRLNAPQKKVSSSKAPDVPTWNIEIGSGSYFSN